MLLFKRDLKLNWVIFKLKKDRLEMNIVTKCNPNRLISIIKPNQK